MRATTLDLRNLDFPGQAAVRLESLKGGEASVNAGIIEKLLAGESGPHRNAVVLNAAGALVVQGLAADLSEGGERAREAIDSGAAEKVLASLRQRS